MLSLLGKFVVRHRILIIIIWLVLLFPALYGATHLHEVLQGEVASAPGAEMYQQEALLNKDFPDMDLYNILIVIESDKYQVDDPQYESLFNQHLKVLDQQEDIAPAQTYKTQDGYLSENRKQTFINVGLKARDYAEADKVAVKVSEALKQIDPGPDFNVFLTGGPLFGREITTVSGKDGFNTEKKVLPLVLVVLVVAFGGFIAAGIPLITGMFSTLMTLGLLYVIAHYMQITSLSQNITSMLGLGVGIDYSLLFVNRFREELFENKLSKEEAAIRTLESSGRTILYSGTVVSIGLFALLFPNVVFMHSLGLSGLLVVGVTILIGLTLLPALLSLIGEGIIWPRVLSDWTYKTWGQGRFWYHWAKYIMSRPVFFSFVSIGMLVCLSLFTLEMRTWNTTIRIMPDDMETKQGFEKLLEIDPKNLFAPIIVTFETKDGTPIWQEKNLRAAYDFMNVIKTTEPVAGMVGLVNTFQPYDSHLPLYQTIAGYGGISGLKVFQPELSLPFISSDETKGVLVVYHKYKGYDIKDDSADIKTIRNMRTYRDQSTDTFNNFNIKIGGMSAIPVEMKQAIDEYFPFIIISTMVVTYLLTMFSFGSVLLPLKAVVLNLLSVTATYGCMVLVFQKGLGASLLQIKVLPEAILIVSPLILFCIIFGLSMDYEIFLLNRIREEYDAGHDNEEAIALGMEKTGGIITNAGLIMILIFLGFAYARIIVIKEFGFGLATAIFIDATIIRLMVVPAIMKLFGDANWYFPKFLDIPFLRKVLKE